MRVLLKDLAPGTKYAVQFRAYNGDGYSDWSQIMYFDTTGDTMPPAAVENLTWTVTGGTFTAGWNKVVFNKDGSLLNDFRDYQITISDGDPNTAKVFSSTSESFSFPLDLNQNTFGRIMPTLTITVRARDYSGNLADPVSLTCTDPKPAKPTTPAVSTYLGQLVVGWDGNGTNGYAMPYNFDHLDIYVSTDPNFTPSKDTLNQTIYSAAKIIVSGLEYNTAYYVRFVAVNTIGQESDPSDVGSGTPNRISGLDIQNGAISFDQINFAGQLGPSAFYAVTAPTSGMKGGDIWYDKSNRYAPSVWNATTNSWQPSSDIGVVSGTRIIAGTVTADQIGTNKIITSSANIGTAVIDDSNIGNLNAGKITAGVLQSGMTVTVDGTSRPAWSMDTAGVATFNSANIYGTITVGSSTNTAANNAKISMQSYNYLPGSAGWAVKGNGDIEFNSGVFRGTLTGNTINSATINSGSISGTSISAVSISGTSTITGATITGGTLQTASSGARVQMDTTGLNLFNASGQNTVNLSTTGAAVITGLYKSNYSGMRVEIDGSYTRQGSANPWTVYAGIRMFTNASNNSEWGEIGTGADPTYSNVSTLQVISPGATANSGSFLRLRNDNTWSLYGNSTGQAYCVGTLTLQSTGSSVNIQANSSVSITGSSLSIPNTVYAGSLSLNPSGSFTLNASGAVGLNGSPITFNVGSSYGYVAVSTTSGSPLLVISSNSSGAGALKFAYFGSNGTTDPGGTGLSVLNTSDTGYQMVRCSSVASLSDIAAKSNVTPATSLLAQVVGTPVYEYDMDADHEITDSKGQVKRVPRKARRRGVLAHEAPSQIVVPGSSDPNAKAHEKMAGIDIYAMAATSWGAIKELHDTIEALKQEVAKLKGTQ